MQQNSIPAIAHMVDTTHLGGAERMAVNIVNDLCEANEYVIHLIVSRNEGVGSALTKPAVHTTCLHKTSSWDIVAFRKFITYLKVQKISILHAHTNSVYWALAAKMFFIPDLSVIWHDHLGARAESSSKFNLMASRFSRMLDGYIGVSEKVMGWAKRYIKLKPNRIIFLPNYPALKEPSLSAVDFFMSKRGTPTFLCLGNYRVEKEQLLLVKAFEQVLEDLPQARLWLAGKDIQPGYKSEVMQLIATLKLQEHITDMGECTDVAAIIKATDIGVFASRFEGLPVSLLEFGLLGKPVVATEVGEMPKILGNGKWGALVAPHKIDDLAKAMVQVGKDQVLRKIWANEFQQYVKLHYSKSVVISQLSGYYSIILGSL